MPDQRCKGLAVRVAPSGVKTWDLAYRIRGTGKMRRLSLGRTTDVSLEQARERANELTSAARGGRDLIGEEERGQRRGSLADHRRVVDRPLSSTASFWPSAHRQGDREPSEAHSRPRSFSDVPPIFADATFGSSWTPSSTRATCGKRKSAGRWCGAMFRWALSQDIVEADPTAGLEAYDPGTPRDRVLTVEEIETLWRWFDSDRSPRKRRTS